MRIAIVAPPWLPVPPRGYGGTERVVALLADGLVDRGHEVTLFAPTGSRTRARLISPLAPLPVINGHPEEEAFHALCALSDLDQFDVVHDHTTLGPVVAALRGDLPPVVHTLHGRWTAANRRLLGAIAPPTHLVAISHAQRRDNTTVPYAGVVHNGIDLVAHPFRAEKEDFLVFLGRSSAEKGPEVAVEVAREAGLPLVMLVKREEPEEWRHWDEVVRPKLTPAVTVIEQPPHERKVELLSRARALVSPIDWPEPFGLVFAEAAACGTPVITRPLGAAPEVVRHDVTGYLCDTVADMVAAVQAATDVDPAACRAHVEREFSADVMTAGYEGVFASVSGESPVGPDRQKVVPSTSVTAAASTS